MEMGRFPISGSPFPGGWCLDSRPVPARSPALTIDRCTCRQVPFARLLPRARAAGWALADLVRETGCGNQCGLCRPYLRRMLATGETAFHELLTEAPDAD